MKKNRRSLLVVVTLSILMAFNSYVSANGTLIRSEEKVVANYSELAETINNATSNTTISLSNDFEGEITSTISLIVNSDINIIVNGNNQSINASNITTNTKHMTISNNGLGTIEFKDLTFVGDTISNSLFKSTGGLKLNKGNYKFDNVNFNKNNAAIEAENVNSLEIVNSTFEENSNQVKASAIDGEGRINNLTIKNSSFINNQGGDGFGYSSGAIWIKYGGNTLIENSYFKGNIARSTGGGGAIAFTAAQNNNIQIKNSYFEDNKANSSFAQGSSWSDGGAIYYYGQDGGTSPFFSVENSTFVNNYAHDDGGAILLEQPSSGAITQVINSTFLSNQANGKGSQGITDSSGGAIQVAINSDATLINNTFTNNISGGAGSLNPNQMGGAIATHNDSGREPKIKSINNLFSENISLYPDETVNNSSYSSVHVFDFEDTNSIGVDNGVAIDNDLLNNLNIFGSTTPTTQRNYSVSSIGNPSSAYYLNFLPTIPIIPSVKFNNNGISTPLSEYDARGVKRLVTPDVGAVDMNFVKYNSNGGVWELEGTINFDGTSYYTSSESDNYYEVGYYGYSTNVVDNEHLKNPSKVFLGWSYNATSDTANFNIGDQIVFNEDVTLYAVWGEIPVVTYTVTFDSVGGSVVAPITKIPTDTLISAPTNPTRTNHEFKGWYKDATYTNAWDFASDKVTSDITLYAKWEEVVLPVVEHTVTFDSVGGSSVAPITNIPTDTLISAPTNPILANHEFKGWYKDAAYTSAWNFASDKVTSDIILYAKWEEAIVPVVEHTVTFDSVGGSSVAPITKIPTNTLINAPADPILANHEFKGWYKDEDYTSAWDFASDKVTSDITLYAKWQKVVKPIEPTKPVEPTKPTETDKDKPATGVSTMNVVVPAIGLLASLVTIAFLLKKKEKHNK